MLKIETENKKLIWKLPEKESDQLFTHLSLQLIELTGGVAKGAAERTEDIPDLVHTGEKGICKDGSGSVAGSWRNCMNEKKFITKEQAVYILPDGNLIHTFYQLGSSLVGADWSREEIIEKIQKSDILELTGEIAKGMGHGLVAYDKDTERQSQILFIETNAERLEEVENGRNKEMNCKKCIHDPIC